MINQLDKAVSIRLARLSFWEYCLYMDETFFKKREFLKEIADAFQAVHDNYVKGIAIKVAVSMPPRAGKSYVTSLFCAWWIGNHPELCVMRNTVTSSLYMKFSYDVRGIIKERKYREVFPKIQLSDDRQNINGWSVVQSKQGAYFGGGVGTNIIGFGANLAITDDLYSGFEQALSETYNDSVKQWKAGSHNSRMEKNCPEIYIGTRWSKRDVIGEAVESGVEYEVKIPALTDERKSFCEDVKSTEEYLKIEADTEELIWMAEYMQEPLEASGLLFPIDQLNKYNSYEEVRKAREFLCIPVDPANKGGDYFAAPYLYLVGNRIYVDKFVCNQDGSDENSARLAEDIVKLRADSVRYEGVFHWQQEGKKLREAIQDKFDDCDFVITNPTTNKQTRILAEAAFIKNHFYFREDWKEDKEYRKGMTMLMTYLKNQTGNKTAANDDSPDVLAAGSSYMKKNFSHLF